MLSLRVHESPESICKVVASAFPVSSDSQKSAIPQNVKKHSKSLKLQMNLRRGAGASQPQSSSGAELGLELRPLDTKAGAVGTTQPSVKALPSSCGSTGDGSGEQERDSSCGQDRICRS